MPQSDLEQILQQLSRLDDKLDDLRKELFASFVLKQVFEIALESRDKAIEELKRSMEEHRQVEMGKMQKGISIVGGILGAVSTALLLLQQLIH